MITEEQEKAATRILNTLERQSFAAWYQSGRFDHYLRVEVEHGKPGHISKREILQDITKKFSITPEGKIE